MAKKKRQRGASRKAGLVPGAREVGVLRRLQQLCGRLPYRRLASMADMDPETVRRQMCGISRPSVELVAEDCARLKASPDWLLLGRGRPPADAGGKRG